MKIAYIVSDGGDGSSSVRWFKNVAKAQAAVNNDKNSDSLCGNEGCISTLTLPDNIDLDSIGISKYKWDDDEYDDEGNPV